jgi:predicted outer membrane repeat protein
MKVSFLSVCLLAFLFALPTQAFAVDFTVNLTTDQHDANLADGVCDIGAGTGQCSLRAAVEQAKNLPSNDRVLFNLPANSTITLTVANGGEIRINYTNINLETLEIIGTGANNLTISGGGTSRIFSINIASVTISGVTLTGGNGITGNGTSGGGGGAVDVVNGSLTLNSVYITGNTGSSNGGGVSFFMGTLRVLNSTISGNNGVLRGGGIFDLETNLTVVNSTISGNTAGDGGGIFHASFNLTLRNVTITNNSAFYSGGGIYTQRALNFGNTIVAGNFSNNGFGTEIFQEFAGGLTSVGGNLVGDSSGDSANTGFPIAYQPTDILDTNPQLDILRNNGGTTPTHRLFAASPAIDKGLNSLAVDPTNGNAVLAFDQRGTPFFRIVDGNNDGTPTVDIGAFEFQGRPTAASVSVAGRVTTANRRGISRALVRMTDSTGIVRTTYTNSFGYYSFADVEVGQTVIFDVRSKRYNFTQPTQVISLDGNSSRVNFIAY